MRVEVQSNPEQRRPLCPRQNSFAAAAARTRSR